MNSWNHLITRNLTVVLLLFAIAVPAFAAATTIVRVGEETDITVDSRVRLADTILRPGSYYVQHAPAPSRHAVLFTDVNNPTVVVRTKCRLKRLNGIANYTAIYFESDPNGHRKLASLVIAGENVMHVF